MLRRNRKRPPRYLVRKGEDAPSRYKTVQRGVKHAVFDTAEATDVFVGDYTSATAHARALNHELRGQQEKPYVFDAMTGRKVYEDASLQNCRDHAAFLNRDYLDTLDRASEGRWFEVAFALVRTHFARDPSEWVIRDTGFAFEVRTPDGALVAQCATYADAANVKALADIAHTDMLTPRPQLEAEPPHELPSA